MTRLPHTINSLLQKEPDGVDYVQSNVDEPHDVSSMRLGTAIHRSPDFEPARLASTISSSKRVTYFCDSTVFIGETDQLIWDALLTFGRIAVIPQLQSELVRWVKSPRANLLAHEAVVDSLNVDSSTPIYWLPYPAVQPSGTLDYYARLLGLRKLGWDVAKDTLERQLRRVATPSEVGNFLKKKANERGMLLGRQGRDPKVPDHIYNDEYLVVSAVMYAITSGNEAVIITSDEAVFDQFYKLQWLLDTHYRSMLMADRYASNPFSYSRRVGINRLHDTFHDDHVTLLERPRDPDSLLSREWTPVPVSCLLLSNGFSKITFSAEREMSRLLEVKAKTGGLNTDKLDGQNLHFFLGDQFVEKMGNWVAVSHDVTLPLGESPLALAKIDVELVMLPTEHHRRVERIDPRS